MTLHDLALKWVAKRIAGQINHGQRSLFFWIFGKVPDVIIRSKRGGLRELHEVEVVELSKEKIQAYSISDFRTSRLKRVHRVLWIVLPNLGTAFHEIKVISKSHSRGFEVVY